MYKILYFSLFLFVSSFQTAFAEEKIHLAAAIGSAAMDTDSTTVETSAEAGESTAAAASIKPWVIAVGAVTVGVIAAVASGDSGSSVSH